MLTEPKPAPPEPHRFADKYTVASLRRPAAAAAFTRDYVRAERAYFHNWARNRDTGLTYDGVNLHPATGAVKEVRTFSAASKECLDLAILCKALSGEPNAVLLVGDGDPKRAKEVAREILARKLTSYRAFARGYPGYGGVLPWFEHGNPITPSAAFSGIPALDAGQWLWSMEVTEHALRRAGCAELANGYAAHNAQLRKNAVALFYDAQSGLLRGRASIRDPKVAGSAYTATPGDLLRGEHAVHESVIILWYITLFGEGLTPAQREALWRDSAAAPVVTPYGVTWQGYWGSAHESWAALIAPMRHEPGFARLYHQREVIRTHNARNRGYVGLAASCHDPRGGGYLSAAGIEGVGTQAVPHNDVFTPYAAFPVLLDEQGTPGHAGLAWLLNMLRAPGMQTRVGGGESGTHDGSAAAPIKTIDGTLPTLLALMGGLEHESADMLRARGKYDAFLALVREQYARVVAEAEQTQPAVTTLALPKARPGPRRRAR